MELNWAEREKILKKVVKLVQKRFYDPTLNGRDWPSLVAERRDRILNAENAEEFEKEVHSLVSQLGVSHIGFFHRSANRVPARRSICATFRKQETGQGCRWIFEDIHEEGPASRAGFERGDIVLRMNGQEIHAPEDPVFPMGTTTIVTVLKRDGRQVLVNLTVPPTKSKKFPYCEPRLVSCARLGDGIGWLKVSMFPGQVGIDIAHDIDRAVAELGDIRRLIVDLRGNSGGGLGMIRLMSYFTAGRVPIGYSLTRRRAERGYSREQLARFRGIPSKKITLLWLLVRYGFVDKSITLVTEGLGPKAFHGRMVLLINEHSASASEVIAAFAAESRFATLVGSMTVGRLLSGDPFRVGNGFILVVPTAAYLTWQGNLIEGKGVRPDILVDWSPEEARAGGDNQLEKAVEVVKSL